VIVTVEAIVGREAAARLPGAVKLAPNRVRAIAVEPFGAHPQPLYVAPALGLPGYRDDYDHYRLWRSMVEEPDRFGGFVDSVLRAQDGGAAYRSFVGLERLEALKGPAPPPAATNPSPEAGADERMIVLAARHIARRVRASGYRVILAGLGHAFFAARLARRWLAEEGLDVPVMVETGLYDLDCGPGADSFLLSHHNVARSARHSDVEDILGALTCGRRNACLAVLGAAQVDARGRINTTRLPGGRLLVGSGGAADIAARAAEVLVLTKCERDRLVAEAGYVTSPGRGVLGVATERCVLSRADGDVARWTVGEVLPLAGDVSPATEFGAIRDLCGFELEWSPDLGFALPLSAAERRALHELDPEGRYTRRA
jgi:3-oxoacid CoA-transferase subunit A